MPENTALSLPLRVLFVCTHNRCRSILAEALLRSYDDRRFDVRSAGSAPAGAVHPLTLDFLRREGIALTDLASKSWDALGDFVPDLVITVCDRAAGEACPLWLGRTLKTHWGVPDPTAARDDAAIEQTFQSSFALLRRRIQQLRALPLHAMSAAELQARLELIALTERGDE